MQRPKKATEGEVPALRAMEDSQWEGAYPTLWEWLADDRWEDGAERLTSTLLLFVEDGRWKGCLHDRDGSRSCFRAAATPEQLLEAFEAGLKRDDLDWRSRPPATPSKRRSG